MKYACGNEARVGDKVIADHTTGVVWSLEIDETTAECLQKFGAMPGDPDAYCVTSVGVWRFDRIRLTGRAGL